MSYASSQTMGVVATSRGHRPMLRSALDASRSMIAAMQDAHARRRDASVLARLDDRLLRDIGMSRADIHGLISGVR